MISRFSVNRYKGLLYGPQDALRLLKAKVGGSLSRMVTESRQCRSNKERFAFAVRHFAPCQKAEEILGFLDWANEWKPQRIVEIGVARGGTNYLLTHGIESVELVIGVDFFPRNQRLLRSLAPGSVRLESVSGRSADAETVNRVKALLEGEPIDLLLIDGDHSYEGAMADFQAYRPLVRPGGWIAFHDIQPQQLNADGTAINGFPVEVDRVWAEMKNNYENLEFIEDPDQHSYGIGVVQLPAG
jgi:cephalosporin hydroxylase